MSLSATDAYAHGCVHTLAAFLSLTRFQYRWDAQKPFHLCMPTAREANMWPTTRSGSSPTLSASATRRWSPFRARSFKRSPGSQPVRSCTARRARCWTDEAISGVYSTRLANTLQVSQRLLAACFPSPPPPTAPRLPGRSCSGFCEWPEWTVQTQTQTVESPPL